MTAGEKRLLADAADRYGFPAAHLRSAVIRRIRPDLLFLSWSTRLEEPIERPVTGEAS